MVWVRPKLAREMGISKDNAEQLLQKYHSRVPFVKRLAESVNEQCLKIWVYSNNKGS